MNLLLFLIFVKENFVFLIKMIKMQVVLRLGIL